MSTVTAMALGKQIRAHRLARGMTLEKLEQLSGVAVGTIHALEARDSSRSQYFPALAKAMGISVEDLNAPPPSSAELADQQGVTKSAVQHRAGIAHAETRGADLVAGEAPPVAYGLTPILAWEHPDDLPDGEFVMIPRLDVHLSAGNGHEQQVEIELTKDMPQAFRTEWIRLQRLKPNKLAAMRATGESMEPTIHDGDSLLVDTSQTRVVDDKVYALWYDGGERVKRLFRLPGGGLRIKSDNPRFDTIELPADSVEHVRIIGRIVHRSGTGGL